MVHCDCTCTIYVPILVHSFFTAELNVRIVVNYTAPADFALQPPNYRAASSIVLLCQVDGLEESALSYNWTSTCNKTCFAKGETTQSVQRRVLRSTDSGIHTCTAVTEGFTGHASIEMRVVGKLVVQCFWSIFMQWILQHIL